MAFKSSSQTIRHPQHTYFTPRHRAFRQICEQTLLGGLHFGRFELFFVLAAQEGHHARIPPQEVNFHQRAEEEPQLLEAVQNELGGRVNLRAAERVPREVLGRQRRQKEARESLFERAAQPTEVRIAALNDIAEVLTIVEKIKSELREHCYHANKTLA